MNSIYNGQNRVAVYGYASNPGNRKSVKITDVWRSETNLDSSSFHKTMVDIETSIRNPSIIRYNSVGYSISLKAISDHSRRMNGKAIILRDEEHAWNMASQRMDISRSMSDFSSPVFVSTNVDELFGIAQEKGFG